MSEHQPAEPEGSHDHVSFAEGAEQGPGAGRGRRVGKAVGWIAVGAIGATALTGVAFASSHSSGSTSAGAADASATSAPSAPSGQPGGPGPNGPRMRGGFGGFGGLLGGIAGRGGAVLHGEVVVKTAGGTTETLLGQHGKITAASGTALTVASTDGFTATWSLSSTTKIHAFLGRGATAKASDLKVGDEVVVLGTEVTSTSGDATQVAVQPTAAQLKALAENAPGGGRYGGPGPNRGPGAPWTPPSPAPSGPASPTGA